LTIYSLLNGDPLSAIEARYAGRGYGAFKSDLAEVVVSALAPIQARLADLTDNPQVAGTILANGAERARARAAPKITEVRNRIGLGLG
jgi:tryptophanyl-tRNA synthetase